MQVQEDIIPLEQVIYKPEKNENTLLVLKPETKRKNVNLFLYLIASTANFLSFSSGVSIAWVNPVLPKLLGNTSLNDNPFGRVVTDSEASWIAGILSIGAAFAPLLAAKTADMIGRKRTLLILAIIQTASLVMTIFARKVYLYYIARFSIGFSIGGVFPILAMFLAEIGENHNRGALTCSMSISLACGMNFSLIVGPYLTIKNFCLVSLAPLLIFIPSFFILSPETPVFLASTNNEELLADSLSKLRNKTPEEVRLEVINFIEANERNKQNKGGIRELFVSRSSRKGFVICLVLLILQQFSGVSAILAYTPVIFESVGKNLGPEICTMIIGSSQVVGTILASIVVDRAGRRILLQASSAGMFTTLGLLGLYFYLKINQFEVEWLSWLPVLCLILFIITFSLGLGPVPWAILAEVFPPNIRTLGAAILSFNCFMAAFIVTVTFPFLSSLLGMAKCFWLFSLICLAGNIFICWILPETKGKSLQEIQQLLESH